MSTGLEVLDVRVFGQPVAQSRAGRKIITPKDGGKPFVISYDSEHARDWKRTIVAQVLPQKPPELIEGPLELSLIFYLNRPISLPKSQVFHIKKPDLDNLVKAVKDALKGVVYRDDSQIYKYPELLKVYSPAPGVRIRLTRPSAPPRPEQAQLLVTAEPGGQ